MTGGESVVAGFQPSRFAEHSLHILDSCWDCLKGRRCLGYCVKSIQMGLPRFIRTSGVDKHLKFEIDKQKNI
jgi:hypothetical protein